MSKSVKQILSNLQNAIEALKKGGEDNNNKIDTKKERNQLAKLIRFIVIKRSNGLI